MRLKSSGAEWAGLRGGEQMVPSGFGNDHLGVQLTKSFPKFAHLKLHLDIAKERV